MGGYLPFSWLNIKINFNFLEDHLKKKDCRGARCQKASHTAVRDHLEPSFCRSGCLCWQLLQAANWRKKKGRERRREGGREGGIVSRLLPLHTTDKRCNVLRNIDTVTLNAFSDAYWQARGSRQGQEFPNIHQRVCWLHLVHPLWRSESQWSGQPSRWRDTWVETRIKLCWLRLQVGRIWANFRPQMWLDLMTRLTWLPFHTTSGFQASLWPLGQSKAGFTVPTDSTSAEGVPAASLWGPVCALSSLPFSCTWPV